jgi:predicted lipoprotein with Yx(FWY)xxD motif
MRNWLAIFVFLAAASLAACGGGGSTSSGGGGVNPPAPTPAPTTAPTTAPSTAPQGNIPLSETVAGSAAWVDPATHRTLYFLSVDTATGSACTGGCTSIWPVFVPSANSQASGNMTIITRSDGTGKQWAYQGHPLYMFSGDTGADQAHGEGVMDFGGTWHVARPSSATPAPGGTSPPCTGPYC